MMPDNVHLRAETADDITAIHHLTRLAFAPMPYSDGQEPHIIDRLRRDGDLALSAVAEDPGGRILGHVALSPVQIGGAGAGWYGLGPISVAPGSQRRGIGRRLMTHAMGWMTTRGAAGCALIGDPGFYSRFGFFSDGAVRYGDLDTKYVLRRVLAGPDRTGDLTYAAAFG